MTEQHRSTTSDRAAAISRGVNAKHDRGTELADQTLARAKSGRFAAVITEAQWDWAIERIAAGEVTSRVMAGLGCHRSAILDRCDRDPAFRERYQRALETAYFGLAEDLRAVTRGVEGYSSGDVQRDALIAKYDLALIRALAPRIFGEKLQIEQKSITITLDPDNSDW